VNDPTITPSSGSPDGGPATGRSPAGTWERLNAALQRLVDVLTDLVRRGNRRRLTLRGRSGDLWLRLPLTLAAVLVLIALVQWPFATVLLAIVAFAFGAQLSVDRERDVQQAAPGNGDPGAPTSAA
jgi:hypothetical protein